MEPIHIPENQDFSGFRTLPDGPAVIMLEKMKAGLSKKKQPMITATFVVVEEMANANPDEPETVGAKVVEFYSLQENAQFKIIQDYKEVAKENMPHGDYQTAQDLLDVIAPVMEGSEWDAILENEYVPKEEGEDLSSLDDEELEKRKRTKIQSKIFRG